MSIRRAISRRFDRAAKITGNGNGNGQVHHGGSGGGVPDPTAQAFNPADTAANTTLTNNDRTLTKSAAAAYAQSHGVTQRGTGKRYYEFTVVNNGVVVGMGIGATGDALTHFLGSGTFCGGVYAAGHYEPGTIANFCGGAFANGDVCGIAVDLDTDVWWLRKNNGAWSGAVVGVGDPAAGTGGKAIPAGLLGASNIVPAAVVHTTGDSVTINTGKVAWAYAPPSGFTPWG